MDMMNEQAIELFYPDKDASADWYQRLAFLNKDELEVLAAPFRRILRKKQVTAIDARGNRRVPSQVTTYLSKQSGIKKGEILDFLCFIMADVRNFQYYLDTLSEKDKKVWGTALTQYYVSDEDIYQLTGENWIPQGKSTYYYRYDRMDISDKLFCFQLVQAKGTKGEGKNFWEKNIYCRLYEKLHAVLLPVCFPDACNLEKRMVDELPQDTSWHTFSGESDILVGLSILNGLYETGQLTANKKLTLASLRKLAQAVPLSEFFPQCEVKELALFRSALVMNLYLFGRPSISSSIKQPENMLKEIFVNALHRPILLLPILLPHLTGLRKNELIDSYGTHLALALWDLMGTLPPCKWIQTEGILFRLMQTATRYVTLFSALSFDKMDVVNNKLEHPVYLNRLCREVSVPFVNGLLYAMSAFGFLEVAYGDISPDDASYASSLGYVRLTPLGAYVWGKTTDYTPTVQSQAQGPLFELDGSHMMVRSVADLNPYLPLLAEMGTPVAGKRYRVSAGSFLEGCQSHKDIKERIALFKQYICPEPSHEWEEFFNALLQHSNSVTKVADKEYVIYHIDPADKELQRIISTDPFIRQHSVRAEGYLWLIETQKLKAVQKRLKECGYLF